MDPWARQVGAVFFDTTTGGDPVLIQRVFWVLGHPETWEVLAVFVGLCAACGALMLGRRREAGYKAASLALTAFVATLVLWSVLGWATARPAIDTALHDTYYLVTHFHVMFMVGAGLLVLALIYAGMTVLFRLGFRRWLAVLQISLFTFGIWLANLAPLIFLNHGMPRRYIDYADGVPVQLQTAQTLGAIGYFATLTSLAVFAICIADAVITRLRTRQESRPDP